MQTLELFCGTKSFSKVAAEFGYATFTVDNDASHAPDLTANILLLSSSKLPSSPFVLWASPPCQTFSVLSVTHYWNKDGTPKTLTGHRLVAKTVALIIELNPAWWFIENPRGMLRTVNWFECATRHAPTWRIAPHRHLLPVWRHTPEANRHLDERAMVAEPVAMRSGRSLP